MGISSFISNNAAAAVILRIFLIMVSGNFECNRLMVFSHRRFAFWLTFLMELDQMLETGLRFAGRKIWKKAEEFIYYRQTVS